MLNDEVFKQNEKLVKFGKKVNAGDPKNEHQFEQTRSTHRLRKQFNIFLSHINSLSNIDDLAKEHLDLVLAKKISEQKDGLESKELQDVLDLLSHIDSTLSSKNRYQQVSSLNPSSSKHKHKSQMLQNYQVSSKQLNSTISVNC